jgi:2,3-bisphosphoglycerate-dependent phosphoglycerate mutase
MIEVWLVRHAQSQNNAAVESQRQPDPALTELGQWQAENLAEYLHPQLTEFRQLSVSGFRRALQTAAPLGVRPCPQPFQIWLDVHEVGGCYTGWAGQALEPHPGLSVDEVRQQFPWALPPADWTQGGWNRLPAHETVADAIPRADRVAAALQRVAAAVPAANERVGDRTPSHKWLIVSHGEFIALLLSRLLTSHGGYFVRPRSIYNTSITKVRVGPTDNRLLEFNQIEHLARQAISS